ncbi:MAG: hypothetical protein KDA86_21595 [Planctomycetaceae bacterium]|nr:hypothetical protein [Planctomycetaceae bacterium]
MKAEGFHLGGYGHLQLPDDDELNDIVLEELRRRIKEFTGGFPDSPTDDIGL